MTVLAFDGAAHMVVTDGLCGSCVLRHAPPTAGRSAVALLSLASIGASSWAIASAHYCRKTFIKLFVERSDSPHGHLFWDFLWLHVRRPITLAWAFLAWVIIAIFVVLAFGLIVAISRVFEAFGYRSNMLVFGQRLCAAVAVHLCCVSTHAYMSGMSTNMTRIRSHRHVETTENAGRTVVSRSELTGLPLHFWWG